MQASSEECYELNLKEKFTNASQEDMLPPSLQQSIENIIEKEKYLTNKIYKRTISTDGGNYLGVLYEVDVKGKTAKGDKETNIFIKNIINGDKLKESFSVPDAYLAESYFYKELSKVFTQLEDEAGVPDDERYKAVKSYDETNSEAIILENVAKQGFKTLYRMEVVPPKFVEMSIQQLARFHGLSFVLQKRRPEYFEKNIRSMKAPFRFGDDWKAMASNLANNSLKYLEGDNKRIVEKYIPTFLEKYPKYLNDTTSTTCCLCHGDFRANNILAKELDGNVVEVIPVDFQLLHFGCPVNDFIYFIFGCTDREFRKQHLADLKDLYYETFSRFLKFFDMNPEKVYSREEFETVFRDRFDYSLMIAVYIFPLFFVSEDNVPDVGEDDMMKVDMVLDIRFQERFLGVLEDCIEAGCV